jgi:urea carboxylase-associated protein 2
MEASTLWKETIPGAGTWSHILKRGTALRLMDTEGGANVGAYFLNAALPAERFNLPDTLKAQHTAKLTRGHVLMSDMGRILCSITEDSLGWHDPLSGCSNAALVAKKYGQADYQEHRNAWHQNAYDGFLIELAKYGLGCRDLQATVNFFSKVSVSQDGALKYAEAHSPAGSFVELRAELDTLVILNTCQHPLDPSPVYAPKPVELVVSRVPPPADDDYCFTYRPENGRAWLLTQRYLL